MSTSVIRRFVRQSQGSVVPLLGLALVPIVGAVGAAVDYSRASSVKTTLQAALDSAVLAGAKDGTSNWNTIASNMFNGNPISKNGSTVATPTFAFDGNSTYTGQVTAKVPTSFGILGFATLNVSANSTVAKGSGPDNSCILTLDQGQARSDVSLTLNGAPNVSLNGCSIRSNTSMNCNGHNGTATASIAAGTTSGCSNPENYAAVVPDIYSPLAKNITIQCGSSRPGVTWTGGSSAPKGVITVASTGYTEYHVCGDLTVSGNGYLPGNPAGADSVIVIENGSLNIADGAQINTSRTAIVLTGTGSYPSSINFPKGKGHAATLALSPPTTGGNWQGISLYQDPALTSNVDDTWGPGATFNADGVVYLPHANLVIHGSSASNNSLCTKLVVNSFTTNGSVNLDFAQTNSGCTSLGMKQWTDTPIHLAQ
jgi:type II secretory pathway pseudopilin PulG